jgi:hypothetical protein
MDKNGLELSRQSLYLFCLELGSQSFDNDPLQLFTSYDFILLHLTIYLMQRYLKSLNGMIDNLCTLFRLSYILGVRVIACTMGKLIKNFCLRVRVCNAPTHFTKFS